MDGQEEASGGSTADVVDVASRLMAATSLPDWEVFDIREPRYTTVDYYRMACHAIFECRRCGTCCTTGDPIRLAPEDLERIARHLKMPVQKAKRKLVLEAGPGSMKFRRVLPCRFYDPVAGGCKIYDARPWSCRIFPFLGIYGSEDRVKVHESCPGSLQAYRDLTSAIEDLRAGPVAPPSRDDVRRAKEWFRALLDDFDR